MVTNMFFTNENFMQCTRRFNIHLGRPNLFHLGFFWGGGDAAGFLVLSVPNVFASSSQDVPQVSKVFLKMFPKSPKFFPPMFIIIIIIIN
jgi:hypothetical protein